MIMSGWFNFVITSLLFGTLVSVVVYYYRPKAEDKAAQDEAPKWRMLSDEDEKP